MSLRKWLSTRTKVLTSYFKAAGQKIPHLTEEDKILALFVGAYFVDLLFDAAHYGSQEKKSFFPFFHGFEDWDGKMTLENYVYGYAINVYRMMMFRVFYQVSGREFFMNMVVIEFMDLVDYMLIYNHTWINVKGIDFEFNYIKLGLIVYLSWREFGHKRLVHY